MNMFEAKIFFSHVFAIAVKASSIAQIIRKQSSLFELLIEDKKTNEFLNFDCKTFADVLIQETARYDLNYLYPNLGEKLLGEETNKFTNKLNVSIEVKVCENVELTKNMILKAVDNNEELAENLSIVIHKNINEFNQNDFITKLSSLSDKRISLDSIELWIDPIDSTKEYVTGIGLVNNVLDDVDSIKNATVLIGVYNKITGIPLAGVICQPFHHMNSENLWLSSCYWGINFDSISLHSDNIEKRVFSFPGQVITSYREVEELSTKLNNNLNSKQWEVFGKAGAGYKLLSLLTCQTDCCVLSKGSTYKWDTCGPHGILLSVGGGIVDYKKITNSITKLMQKSDSDNNLSLYIGEMLNDCQIRYDRNEDKCNSGGFIAYSNSAIAVAVIKALNLD